MSGSDLYFPLVELNSEHHRLVGELVCRHIEDVQGLASQNVVGRGPALVLRSGRYRVFQRSSVIQQGDRLRQDVDRFQGQTARVQTVRNMYI